MSQDKPLVSVCMITYNHEKYIAEAIEGVLMQEVDFPIELLIADDASPDRTAQIVEEYINNHPKGYWINYYRHTENKGMMHNFVWALEKCKGKYIALCDGDDYWIDSKKLIRQVNFLESNPDFSIVSHYAKKMSLNENTYKIVGKLEQDVFDINYPKFRFYALPTASLLFRKIISYPDWIFNAYGGDRAIIYICCYLGKLRIMDFIGSFYRIHPGGIEQYYEKYPDKKFYRNINEYLVYVNFARNRFKVVLFKMITLNFISLSKLYLKNGEFRLFLNSFFEAIKYYLYSLKFSIFR